MGLVKHRPALTLLAPRVVRSGEDFNLTARVDCSRKVRVDELRVRLTGYLHEAGGFRRLASSVAEIPVGHDLDVGSHPYAARFRIEPDAPSSYRGRVLRVDWVVEVRVDIPWWPDRVERFVLRVVGPGWDHRTQRQARSVVYVPTAGGVTGRPYLEVALDRTDVTPGGTIRGKAAFYGADTSRFGGLVFSLVAREANGSFRSDYEHALYRVNADLASEGDPIAFALAVPEDLVPQWRYHGTSLRWLVRAKAVVKGATDPELLIPIAVVPSGRSGDGGDDVALAVVGDERAQTSFARVGAELGLDVGPMRLSTSFGDAQFVLERQPGPLLVASLSMPDQRLGLRREQRALSQDRVVASDTGHTKALGELESIPDKVDDTGAVFEARGAGLDADRLSSFATRALAEARAFWDCLSDLDTPPALAAHADQAQSLARSLGAAVVPRNLVIHGRVGREHGNEGWGGFELWPELHSETQAVQWMARIDPDDPIDLRRQGVFEGPAHERLVAEDSGAEFRRVEGQESAMMTVIDGDAVTVSYAPDISADALREALSSLITKVGSWVDARRIYR